MPLLLPPLCDTLALAPVRRGRCHCWWCQAVAAFVRHIGCGICSSGAVSLLMMSSVACMLCSRCYRHYLCGCLYVGFEYFWLISSAGYWGTTLWMLELLPTIDSATTTFTSTTTTTTTTTTYTCTSNTSTTTTTTLRRAGASYAGAFYEGSIPTTTATTTTTTTTTINTITILLTSTATTTATTIRWN